MGEFIRLGGENKWDSGVSVEEYKGTYSLAAAYETKDGKVALRWAYPDKDRKPAEKAQPVKIVIGTRDDAIELLRAVAGVIKGGKQENYRPPESKHEPPPMPDDSDVPF